MAEQMNDTVIGALDAPTAGADGGSALASPAAAAGAAEAHGAERPTVGILGLGLIGGSFARAYTAAGWRVLAWDNDADTLAIARIDVLAGFLRTPEDIASCDLIILAAYPDACLAWLRAHAGHLGEATRAAHAAGRPFGPIVIDAAGVKAHVCEAAFPLACEFGFGFCGAHPMAGSQHSGFAHSRADMFAGAPMVLTPPALPDTDRLDLLDRVHELLGPCGFGEFSLTTPQEHDAVIAFTSQLAHVVSNAYVKSPTAQGHHGFSAGSYKDLTRVAHLNPAMWTELMMENADNLAYELRVLIENLSSAHAALQNRDSDALRELLAQGDRIKRELDDRPAQR